MAPIPFEVPIRDGPTAPRSAIPFRRAVDLLSPFPTLGWEVGRTDRTQGTSRPVPPVPPGTGSSNLLHGTRILFPSRVGNATGRTCRLRRRSKRPIGSVPTGLVGVNRRAHCRRSKSAVGSFPSSLHHPHTARDWIEAIKARSIGTSAVPLPVFVGRHPHHHHGRTGNTVPFEYPRESKPADVRRIYSRIEE